MLHRSHPHLNAAEIEGMLTTPITVGSAMSLDAANALMRQLEGIGVVTRKRRVGKEAMAEPTEGVQPASSEQPQEEPHRGGIGEVGAEAKQEGRIGDRLTKGLRCPKWVPIAVGILVLLIAAPWFPLLPIAPLLGLIPAAIARYMGRNAFEWWRYGTGFFLLLALTRDFPQLLIGLTLAPLLGLLPATLARNRGRSFSRWWRYSTASFFLLLVLISSVGPNEKTRQIGEPSAPSQPAPSGTMRAKGGIGCFTKAALSRAMDFIIANDEVAGRKLLETGQCIAVRPGASVIVEEVSKADFTIRIRAPGDLRGVWVPIEMVE
jgi:hypothetical protein